MADIPPSTNQTPGTVRFREALWYWLKLGFISFGGPAGQISMMHQELVERRRWISEKRFLHALNYTMILPGPEAQQLATYIGWLMHGVRGGIAAGVLFVLPSFFILILLSWLYLRFGDVSVVQGILYGIKPAVTAIVLFAAYRIGSRALSNHILRAIALLAFAAIFFFDVSFPWIVVCALVSGVIGVQMAPEKFRLKSHAAHASATNAPAIIDDDTPVPLHARYQQRRILRYVIVGLCIWGFLLGGLTMIYGWQHTLTQMSWFFTKAALVTFGGAYAVLPYVYQGGVEHYQWLTASQMIDGLALGETTPGPLIMVVAFVGFVGAWTKEIFGPELLPLAGIAGAAMATVMTFLPSFLFILVGGPAVEATRHELRFTAPLSAVTAAVVGVVVNLACFFAYHVLWPDGFSGRFDIFSALLGAAAFAALFYFRQGIVSVIGGCALIGLGYHLLMP